ncbi:hypothetical protein [Lentzea sp. NPDC055074]
MTALKQARSAATWSQATMVRKLRAVAAREGESLPGDASMIRMVARWENGAALPSEFYQRLLCALYGRSQVELGFRVAVEVDRDTLVAVLYVAPFDPAARPVEQLRAYAQLVVSDPRCEAATLADGIRQARQCPAMWLDVDRLRTCESVADVVLAGGQPQAVPLWLSAAQVTAGRVAAALPQEVA